MNPYQALAQSLMAEKAPQVPTGVSAFKTDVDVAENIGHEKLKKQAYNPYNLIAPQAPVEEGSNLPMRQNFRREMLRDVTE